MGSKHSTSVQALGCETHFFSMTPWCTRNAPRSMSSMYCGVRSEPFYCCKADSRLEAFLSRLRAPIHRRAKRAKEFSRKKQRSRRACHYDRRHKCLNSPSMLSNADTRRNVWLLHNNPELCTQSFLRSRSHLRVPCLGIHEGPLRARS